MLRHRPGQYLTFWLEISGHHPLKRNYSISRPRRANLPHLGQAGAQGVVSNWLHDRWSPAPSSRWPRPPASSSSGTERPIVLISGGVGLTPLVSMLETVASQDPGLPVHYVHGTQHGAHPCHGAGPGLAAVRRPNPDYDLLRGTAPGRPAGARLRPRRPDQRRLAGQNTPLTEADYFLCGPRGFLRTFVERTGPSRRAGWPHPLRVLRPCGRALAA